MNSLLCGGFWRVEEVAAEGPERARFVGGRNKEREVVITSAIGDHADWNVAEGTDDADFEAEVLPGEVANDTDDDQITVDGDGTVALEVVNDFFEVLRVVYGDGDAHFGGGDHIDGGAVVLEGFEDFAHKAGGQEHASAFDPNGGDVVFGSDGFDCSTICLI